MSEKLNCCCTSPDHGEDCMICGKPLVYFHSQEKRRCSVCGKIQEANAACENGHFICDDCHSSGSARLIYVLLESREKDPVALFLKLCQEEKIHLHGPEHHCLLPCVLLTAYHNCGGILPLADCLHEAWKRGKKIPGGSCGFLGVCGAAAGAGIFASILTEASPLTGDVWHIPQLLTSKCLQAICQVGGPRCCKRTCRLAIETAAQFVREYYHIDMPLSRPRCSFSHRNRECIGTRCPFFSED